MKAGLAVCLLLAVAACSIGPAPLPKATATIGSKHVSLQRGSYCWSSWGKGECADAAPPDALLRTGYLKPVAAASGQRVEISFDRAPDRVEPASKFELPSATGQHVYIITGYWPEGDVSFFLAVDVGG